jgi:predicted DNA-binding protein YlxM (UPF0122 family)
LKHWSVEEALTIPVANTIRELELDGIKMPVVGWAENRGWPPGLIYWRLWNGWSVEDALTIPPGYKSNVLEIDGNRGTIPVLADIYKIVAATVRYRLSVGWSLWDALCTPVCKTLRVDGKELSYAEVGAMVGISPQAVYDRVKRGHSVEQILVTKNQSRSRKFIFEGESLGIAAIARKANVALSSLQNELKKGLSIEEAVAKCQSRRSSQAKFE